MSIAETVRPAFTYKVYGLTLATSKPLPGLRATSDHAPVDVWVDFMGEPSSKASAPQATLNFTPYQNQEDEFGMRVWTEQTVDGDYIRLWFRGSVRPERKVDFRIDEKGERVWCTWIDSPVEEVIAVLLGSVLGYVLRLRGIACLHASTVAVGERAIAFVGEKGAGKSTTAAALSQRQMSILSDDITVLKQTSHNFSVQAGYPSLRLWPEAVDALYGSEMVLPPVLTGWEKRYLNLTDNQDDTGWRFQNDALTLAAIYVLEERMPSLAAPAIKPIPPTMALMTLMAHRSASFLTLTPEKQAREFAFLSDVVKKVPVRKVSRPDSLDALPQLCDAILEDLAGIPT